MIKILHISPALGNLNSGMHYSIPSLCEAQDRLEGVQSDMLIVKLINNHPIKSNHYLLSEIDDIQEFFSNYSIACFHSTFILEFPKISRILRSINVPYIITPRGGLTKGALNKKRIKKELAYRLFFSKHFKKATSYHFLTRNEMENSIKVDSSFICPNGIVRRSELIPSSNVKRIVFVGRLDPYHKGLDLLVDTIYDNQDFFISKSIIVEIYGPTSESKPLTDLIGEKHIQGILIFKGPIYGEEKHNVLRNADAFIQLSRFEGLPMGLLEAMSFGLPCIVTPGTNLSDEVELYHAGEVVGRSTQSVINGIRNLVNSGNLRAQHDGALKLADKYSWFNVATTCVMEYQKILSNE